MTHRQFESRKGITVLEITKERNDSQLTVTLVGRIDSTTAPELEASLEDELKNVTDVVFEAAELTYISSAGLRVILATRKALGSGGSVEVLNPCEEVRGIFEVTKLDRLVTVK